MWKYVGATAVRVNFPSTCSTRLGRLKFSTVSHTMNDKTIVLAEGIKNKQRDCLARAITLIESSHKLHRIQAKLLLDDIAVARSSFPASKPTLRLGIAGPPGKSSC